MKTPFDNPLEEDVILEDGPNVQDISNLLKNSENIFKAFLYLKELFSAEPTFNKIVKIDYLDSVTEKTIDIDPTANFIVFKNNKKDDSYIWYNDNDKLVLYPYEQFEIPLFEGDTIKITGTMNVIQIRYEIR